MKRLIWIFLVISVLMITGCSKGQQDDKDSYATTFRLAESHPYDHPTAQADYEFARLVEEKSEGRIKIIVYTDKELGEEVNVVEQLRFGAIDFARVSTGPIADVVPILKIIQLPYLYQDADHMWRVLDSYLGDEILDRISEYEMIGLGWMDGGARSFYSTTGPIETVDDLVGKRYRVMQSELLKEMVTRLGATAVALPYGDVYSALQTGEIDGAENNWPSYDTAFHFEVAPYYSVDEHVRVPEVLVASSTIMEVLTDEDLALIKEAAYETEIYQRRLWLEHEATSKAKMEAMGVIINVVEDRSAFKEAVAPIYEKYSQEYGDLIEAIQAMATEEP